MSFKSVMLAGTLLLAGAGAANAAVVESDLNLRSGPGTGYGVVAVMPAGARVDVVGCTGSWCRVAYGSAEGYASRNYLGGRGAAYAGAPVYVEPPLYGPPVYGYDYAYAPPLFGFGFGFGGWHRGFHHFHHGFHHWHH
ncbi:MAG TPA: SH3 domain-containing protein [Pseudolabrys sp.]|nr:SH3 domain-containing protein [Pseudolabrys sp.]